MELRVSEKSVPDESQTLFQSRTGSPRTGLRMDSTDSRGFWPILQDLGVHHTFSEGMIKVVISEAMTGQVQGSVRSPLNKSGVAKCLQEPTAASNGNMNSHPALRKRGGVGGVIQRQSCLFQTPDETSPIGCSTRGQQAQPLVPMSGW